MQLIAGLLCYYTAASHCVLYRWQLIKVVLYGWCQVRLQLIATVLLYVVGSRCVLSCS